MPKLPLDNKKIASLTWDFFYKVSGLEHILVCMYVFHCWSWDQKCSQPVKAVSSISDMPWGYIKLLFGTYLAFA